MAMASCCLATPATSMCCQTRSHTCDTPAQDAAQIPKLRTNAKKKFYIPFVNCNQYMFVVIKILKCNEECVCVCVCACVRACVRSTHAMIVYILGGK